MIYRSAEHIVHGGSAAVNRGANEAENVNTSKANFTIHLYTTVDHLGGKPSWFGFNVPHPISRL